MKMKQRAFLHIKPHVSMFTVVGGVVTQQGGLPLPFVGIGVGI